MPFLRRAGRAGRGGEILAGDDDRLAMTIDALPAARGRGDRGRGAGGRQAARACQAGARCVRSGAGRTTAAPSRPQPGRPPRDPHLPGCAGRQGTCRSSGCCWCRWPRHWRGRWWWRPWSCVLWSGSTRFGGRRAREQCQQRTNRQLKPREQPLGRPPGGKCPEAGVHGRHRPQRAPFRAAGGPGLPCACPPSRKARALDHLAIYPCAQPPAGPRRPADHAGTVAVGRSRRSQHVWGRGGR